MFFLSIKSALLSKKWNISSRPWKNWHFNQCRTMVDIFLQLTHLFKKLFSCVQLSFWSNWCRIRIQNTNHSYKSEYSQSKISPSTLRQPSQSEQGWFIYLCRLIRCDSFLRRLFNHLSCILFHESLAHKQCSELAYREIVFLWKMS